MMTKVSRVSRVAHASHAPRVSKHALLLAVAGLQLSCSSTDEGAKWAVAFEHLAAGMVSISGTSSTDVWTVGGDPGTGPTVLHFDGSAWKKMATGSTGDLWWVHAFTAGPVFMGGQNGTILRYQDGAFEKMTTPGTSTVYGIWGVSPTDVWAVGGEATGAGFVWRYDGTSWTPLAQLPAEVMTNNTAFKVWGNAGNDVWICGSSGLMLHWDGTSITTEDAGTTRTLFTVYTTGDLVTAVGGFGTGVIVERSGLGFTDVATPSTPQLNGVMMRSATEAYAVGLAAEIYTRKDGTWKKEATGLTVDKDLHGVWIDETGGVWAVGGDVLSLPLLDGIILHKGPAIPGGTFTE